MRLAKNAVEVVHRYLKEYLSENMTVVDATLGNGRDSLFVGEVMGSGKIIGFDIQERALETAKARMADVEGPEFIPILASHDMLKNYVKEADAVMFNLGYLPGGNKEITTKAETTLPGIKEALEILKPGGLITIVCYPGHEEGLREYREVSKALQSLEQREYLVHFIDFPNQIHQPPKAFIIEKSEKL